MIIPSHIVMVKKEQKKVYEICGAIGQVSYFKGVSRFLLSTEECVECAGTGFQLQCENGGVEITKRLRKKERNKKQNPDKFSQGLYANIYFRL